MVCVLVEDAADVLLALLVDALAAPPEQADNNSVAMIMRYINLVFMFLLFRLSA